jgi:SprT protein
MITQAIKSRVEARIKQDIATIKAKYGKDLPMPTVSYDLRGTTAGTASGAKWHIQLNAVLLAQNTDDFMIDTVPHEFAHLACHQIYPQAYETEIIRTARGVKRTKRSIHGSEWKSIMVALGCDPSRCHRYDVTDARVKRRLRYDYKCSGCQQIMAVGPKHHANLQRGAVLYHKGCHGHKLVFVGDQQPVQRAAQAPAATPKPATNRGESKLARCEGWYQHYKVQHADRALIIAVFVNEVGCTPAGANTYYASCKKKFG